MRAAIFVTLLLIASVVFYALGYRSGSKQSLLREERESELSVALGMYNAVKATNLTKLQSFIDIKLLANTRDYERRFGVPPATNGFGKHFAEVRGLADQIEKQLVPISAIGTALGTNVTVTIGGEK